MDYPDLQFRRRDPMFTEPLMRSGLVRRWKEMNPVPQQVTVTSLKIPTRKSDLLVSLVLWLECGGTATMRARVRERRAGQNLLSSILIHQSWCNLAPLQRGSDEDEIPSDDPRQRPPNDFNNFQVYTLLAGIPPGAGKDTV